MALAEPSLCSKDTAGVLSAIAVAAGVTFASPLLLDGTTVHIFFK